MEYTNPRYNASGTIDVDINHPVYGWIAFTATPDDAEAHGRELFEAVKDEAAAYVPPETGPEPVPSVVSRFQARAALLQAGLLEQAETAVAAGDALGQLAWVDAQEFRRQSPTVAAIADALGLTNDQLDDLFRAAALIEA